MKDFLSDLEDNPIPHLRELRRAPTRYRHILPLPIIKCYQCIVIGAAKDKLTVAITNTQNMEIIELLSTYTGKTIFPVSVDPMRMQVLIQRMEQCERCSQNFFLRGHSAQEVKCCLYILRRKEINAILMLITSQTARQRR